MIEPINDNIIFSFYDDTTNTRFINKTESGIAIATTSNDQANLARWGLVVSVGPKCTVMPGDYILVESGQWTSWFMDGDKKVWKTDEGQVIMVSDRPHSIYGR